MTRFLPRRPSSAVIIAAVALFVALGGTGYAALSLPKSSVGTKQLRNRAVTTGKIKNGAVTNAKLRNGAVTAAKIKDGAVTASKINTTGLTAPNALHATSADTAASATSATNANHATSADGLTLLASGQSESGTFAAGGANSAAAGYIGEGITFSRPIAHPSDIPNGHIVDVPNGVSATHCPGVGQADPGYLCLYEEVTNGVGAGYGYTDNANLSTPLVGAILYWPSTAPDSYSGGEWTVTAP